ncbi:membrane protein insertion efficiency factor YidD [Helicobacter turcicus]|uniref:Membrane protein insertion efficiency factor YidD n=1 Tax=Helicobacter turcicus TaxID=2867412 RepID=A0ABS7JLS7_9HELI|nr:membrane protein insertion efficiency factor YidD [Helicobacter turcicus]MBX7490344.1 membrane protein insertion efficiency factor YidD [Helicobacter turcicus]MBX7545077.1 membrane protein insertion efficiency factor YidD [Helicobacter turcicus]
MIKIACLFAIESYQCYISPLLGANCRYYPSCSEYAKQTYLFQNPLIATLKTLSRILTCNQFFKGGIVYPSAFLSLQVNVFKPCLVEYWLIPSNTLNCLSYNIPNSTFLKIKPQMFQIIKNYSKVSRV